MTNLKIWTSVHKNELIDKCNIKCENNNINIFLTSKILNEDNINYLNKYFGELCTFYYIWKHNLKSEYIGFQHYRYFLTNTNIHNNEIIIECGWKGEFYNSLLIPSGINSYTYLKCLEYLSKYCNITINDIIEKYLTTHTNNIFICNTFICSWEIFIDLCNYIFGTLNYLFPNNSWKNENILNEYLINIFTLYSKLDKTKYNDPETNTFWAIKYYPGDKRYFIMLFEYFIPLFMNIRYCNIKFTYNSYLHQKYNKIIYIDLQNKQCSLEQFEKCYYKNLFTGIKDIRIINYDNSNVYKKYLENTDAFKYVYKYISFDNNIIDNVKNYIININEYIDVVSPYDFYKTDNYIIKQLDENN